MGHYRNLIAKMPMRAIMPPRFEFVIGKGRLDFQIKFEGEPIFKSPNMLKISQHRIYDGFHARALYQYIRAYMDVPKSELVDWEKDYCGLRDILKSCDRRIGKYHLVILMLRTNSDIVRNIISKRFKV